ncbi:hypothetical protein J1614_005572 [Plenodomus biglobosus]|nr:hypothetical protein J1614_005572 [Plenodomus biglobosus]
MYTSPISPLLPASPATDALLRRDFSYFNISPRTGFLDIKNTAYLLPRNLQESVWEDVLVAARAAWPHGGTTQDANSGDVAVDAWRHSVRNMTVRNALSPEILSSQALLRRVYVVLSMVGHFYIHGGKSDKTGGITGQTHNSTYVPRPLAIPWLQVSSALGLKPVLSYAAQVVWNCTLDTSADIQSSDQIGASETFTGHPSEVAFIIAPARVEFEGAVVLKSIFEILSVHLQSNDFNASRSTVIHELHKIQAALERMRQHLLVLKKDCDPSHFYWTLRPWIAGSGPDGWTYQLDGDAQVNLKLGGSTAGSSSLLQALDSFLGLDFGESHLAFRRSMQEYMPQGHRLLIQTLENLSCQDVLPPSLLEQLSAVNTTSPFRAYVQHAYTSRKAVSKLDSSSDQSLEVLVAYNSVVRALKDFRDEHFRIVSLFVINQASKLPKDGVSAAPIVQIHENSSTRVPLKGTGGSDLAKLLKGYRDSSQAALFDIE